MKDTFLAVVGIITKTFNPSQICVMCLAITFLGAVYSFKTYARNEDFVGFVKQYQEEQIIVNMRQKCVAIRAGNESAKDMYGDRVLRLQRDYERTTGRYFTEPRCDQL